MKHLPFEITPITELTYFSQKTGTQILCKRDDLFPEYGGGSKARMLQYILANVKSNAYDVIVTAGGPCSNFNRACALACAKLGIKMHLIEYTDEPQEFNTSLNYYLCNLAGIEKTRCNKNNVPNTIQQVLDQYKRQSLKTKFVYGGGKSLEGIFAYYDAVKELLSQDVNIDHLFIACGTGTTLTGICAGIQEFFPNAIVHAISTARLWAIEKSVLDNNMQLLNKYLQAKYTFSNLYFHEDYLCGGYAKYNSRLMNVVKECIAKEGLIIDPTYSGKAFYGMHEILTNNTRDFLNKNILFWNTGGIFNLLSSKSE